MLVSEVQQRVSDMTRVRWSDRKDKKLFKRANRPGPPNEVNQDHVNKIMASDDQEATLTPAEVKAICKLSSYELNRGVKEKTFPEAKNPEAYAWRVWYAQDVKAWLEENGLPTQLEAAA